MAKLKNDCDYKIKNEELVVNVLNKMPSNTEIDKMSKQFKIIGDKTRLKILWALKQSKLCVCDICGVVKMSKSAVSHQLKILKELDTIKFEKQGKHCLYSLNDECVNEIINVGYKHLYHKDKKH